MCIFSKKISKELHLPYSSTMPSTSLRGSSKARSFLSTRRQWGSAAGGLLAESRSRIWRRITDSGRTLLSCQSFNTWPAIMSQKHKACIYSKSFNKSARINLMHIPLSIVCGFPDRYFQEEQQLIIDVVAVLELLKDTRHQPHLANNILLWWAWYFTESIDH